MCDSFIVGIIYFPKRSRGRHYGFVSVYVVLCEYTFAFIQASKVKELSDFIINCRMGAVAYFLVVLVINDSASENPESLITFKPNFSRNCFLL